MGFIQVGIKILCDQGVDMEGVETTQQEVDIQAFNYKYDEKYKVFFVHLML